MNYEFGPKAKLVGYFIGFCAGVYSLIYAPPTIKVISWFDLGLFIVWLALMGVSTVANAWGMLHQAELIQRTL